MFLTGSFSGAGFGGPDPEEERDPPPEPTPVTFPTHPGHKGQPWTDQAQAQDLCSLFSRVTKPTDISDHHVEALNITLLPKCPIEDMVPLASDGTSWFPPLEPPEAVDGASEDSQADPLVSRKRKDLEDRLSELRIGNDLGFKAISRRMTEGVRPPRIAYMRKFWEGLECMSQYWDCSLDQYYETTESCDDEEQTRKRQRLTTKENYREKLDGPLVNKTGRTWPLFEELSSEQSRDETSETKLASMSAPVNEAEQVAHDENRKTRSASATPEPRPTMKYKGRRTSTGRSMPDQFRVDTVKAFVEGTIWPFKTSLAIPRMMPRVHFGKLNLPVRQTAAVYSMPNDRLKARQGWLRGPILSVQVRPETDFQEADKQQREEMAKLDLMREFGALLQLAQERQREGKTETKPGEGKWWTTEPRWGGGPGGEVENEAGNSDVVAMAEEYFEANKENNDKNGKSAKTSSASRKKKTPAVLWKELKCGKGYWDPRTDYTAIGRNPDSEYDEIFMISSLNHHISIVKMTVHNAYMEYVTSNRTPHPLPQDPQWVNPFIQRTQWFDFFDVEQRLQAFRALSGVMAYMTRPTESASEVKVDREESAQKSTS